MVCSAVQIAGKKRFTLFAPSNVSQLYLHPVLHPHHGHCQFDPLLLNETDAGLGRARGKVLSVAAKTGFGLLQPEDVLNSQQVYVSPYEVRRARVRPGDWVDYDLDTTSSSRPAATRSAALPRSCVSLVYELVLWCVCVCVCVCVCMCVCVRERVCVCMPILTHSPGPIRTAANACAAV